MPDTVSLTDAPYGELIAMLDDPATRTYLRDLLLVDDGENAPAALDVPRLAARLLDFDPAGLPEPHDSTEQSIYEVAGPVLRDLLEHFVLPNGLLDLSIRKVSFRNDEGVAVKVDESGWTVPYGVERPAGRSGLDLRDLQPIGTRPDVRTYLDCSTAHLTAAEAHDLNGSPVTAYAHPYGGFVNVPADDYPNFDKLSDDAEGWEEYPNLLAVLRGARTLGVCWVNFDADGDTLDGLPTFDW